MIRKLLHTNGLQRVLAPAWAVIGTFVTLWGNAAAHGQTVQWTAPAFAAAAALTHYLARDTPPPVKLPNCYAAFGSCHLARP